MQLESIYKEKSFKVLKKSHRLHFFFYVNYLFYQMYVTIWKKRAVSNSISF